MDPANFTASQINNSIFRSELTGITKGYFQQRFRTSGFYNPCIHLELNVSECFEAYGLYRGNRYCRDYLSDWKECAQQPNSVSNLNWICFHTKIVTFSHDTLSHCSTIDRVNVNLPWMRNVSNKPWLVNVVLTANHSGVVELLRTLTSLDLISQFRRWKSNLKQVKTLEHLKKSNKSRAHC